MMRATVAAFAMLAVGCFTPYQPAGGPGGYGYWGVELGPRLYMIEVKVTPRTGHATAHQYAHRRARELCPNGYDIVTAESGTDMTVVATQQQVIAVRKPTALLTVRCFM